jgi:hypothetical protein
MELAGLEPATSWVRSVRDVDPEGAKGMVQPFPRQVRAGISPPLPCSTHHQLTTPPAVRPLDALTDVGRSSLRPQSETMRSLSANSAATSVGAAQLPLTFARSSSVAPRATAQPFQT